MLVVAYLVVVKRVVVFGIWVVNAFQSSCSIESINVDSVFWTRAGRHVTDAREITSVNEVNEVMDHVN